MNHQNPDVIQTCGCSSEMVHANAALVQADYSKCPPQECPLRSHTNA